MNNIYKCCVTIAKFAIAETEMRTKILLWAEVLFVATMAILAFAGVLLFLRMFGAPLWSQEASGWAQAIGALIAIFTAYFIADAESRSQRKLRNEDNIKSHAQTCVLLDTILGQAGQVIREVHTDLDPFNAVGLALTMRTLTPCRTFVEAMLSRPIPYELSGIVIEAYELMAQVDVLVSAAINPSNLQAMNILQAKHFMPQIAKDWPDLCDRVKSITKEAVSDAARLVTS